MCEMTLNERAAYIKGLCDGMELDKNSKEGGIMSTVIRPSVSKSKEYYISKHKYYELKHFCLQYPEWREEYRKLNHLKGNRIDRVVVDAEGRDITSEVALKRHDLFNKMEMVEQAAIATDPDLKDYILAAVTDGATYEYLSVISLMRFSIG